MCFDYPKYSSFIIFLILWPAFTLAMAPCESNKVILEQLNISSKFPYQAEHLTKWYPSKFRPEKGRVLVLHGLNDKPNTMIDIIKHLNKNGYSALRGALTGHRGSLEEMKSIKKEDWENDIKLFICLIKNKNKIHSLPSHAVAFSMGALLIMDFITKNSSFLYFQSLNFLSPAFDIHWYLKLFTPLTLLPTRWLIPSRNLPEYRSQDGTSLAAYRSFFDTLNNFNLSSLNKLNSSLKIFMDPRDELVSFKSIKQALPSTSISVLNTDSHEHTKLYRHITFSKKSLGPNEWGSLMKRFLKNMAR